jgi:hypothetical protein
MITQPKRTKRSASQAANEKTFKVRWVFFNFQRCLERESEWGRFGLDSGCGVFSIRSPGQAATFEEYIKDPKAKIPGTKMVFAGIKNEQAAKDMWAYLKQFDAQGNLKK